MTGRGAEVTQPVVAHATPQHSHRHVFVILENACTPGGGGAAVPISGGFNAPAAGNQWEDEDEDLWDEDKDEDADDGEQSAKNAADKERREKLKEEQEEALQRALVGTLVGSSAVAASAD
jgi:hypothetical protein